MLESSPVFLRKGIKFLRRRMKYYLPILLIISGILFIYRNEIYSGFILRNDATQLTFRSDGIPITDYGYKQGVYVGPQIPPLTVGKAAVDYYFEMVGGNSTAEVYLLNSINWLIENKHTFDVTTDNGTKTVTHWKYNFSIWDIPSGWHSSMADAEILYALSLSYNYYLNMTYLDLCYQIITGFETSIDFGGNVKILDDDTFWYPETIVAPEFDSNFVTPLILNGFLYSLEDLFNTNILLNDSRIIDIFAKGAISAVSNLHKFDSPRNWSLYKLNPSSLAPPAYHNVHIKLTSTLYNMTGESEFLTYFNKWSQFSTYPTPTQEETMETMQRWIFYGIVSLTLVSGCLLFIDLIQMKARLFLVKSGNDQRDS